MGTELPRYHRKARPGSGPLPAHFLPQVCSKQQQNMLRVLYSFFKLEKTRHLQHSTVLLYSFTLIFAIRACVTGATHYPHTYPQRPREARRPADRTLVSRARCGGGPNNHPQPQSCHPWDPHHSAADKAEAAKHAKSDMLCAQADLEFIPVAADTFGAFGLEGERFLAQLFSCFARRFANDSETSFPGKLQHDCWQRVAVALRKAVAVQLGSAYSQCGGAWVHPFPGDGGEGGSRLRRLNKSGTLPFTCLRLFSSVRFTSIRL